MATGADTERGERRHWYRVSVDTLRQAGIALLILAIAAAGYLAFLALRTAWIRDAAREVIDEAGVLLQRTEDGLSLGGADEARQRLRIALSHLDEARSHYVQGEFSEARREGRRSRDLLRSLLDRARARQQAGEAQVVSIEGRVEYRRGDRGSWRAAHDHLTLRTGDYVKTGPNASAEVMFVDGTLYTVRSNTLFLVSAAAVGSPTDRSIELQYGWVNLNTAHRESRIGTPRAEARVADQSEASVSFDEEREIGRFAAYRGELEVAGEDGIRQRVDSLEVVTQRDGILSEPHPLPRAPDPIAPPANATFDIDEVQELALAWRPVTGAESYALQISRNRLFADNIIDVEDRRTTQATLGLRGEGTFLWRVAALTDVELRGPWSEPARFHVSSGRGGDVRGVDHEPPELVIEGIQAYGSIFIVEGETEPGAAVWINGESATVEADGSFTKTLQLMQEGWGFLDVVARDAWGNEATARRRVFVSGL